MSLTIATINVNGLRNNKKRELVFNWLVSKKYNIICLQETHCSDTDIEQWTSDWKNCGVVKVFGVAVRETPEGGFFI